jgi:hypothetical protein
MTEDEALEELCERAANKNLYFGPSKGMGPMIRTENGKSEYCEFFGGTMSPSTSSRRTTVDDCWVVFGDDAIKLATKLIQRKSFQKSGKFNYAMEMVERENNPDQHNWPTSVKRH